MSTSIDKTMVHDYKVDQMVRDATEHGLTYNLFLLHPLMNPEG